MNATKKNIDIIHNCEERFYNWLKARLNDQGVNLREQPSLSIILDHYQGQLTVYRQHLKPLQKWNRVKDECYQLSNKLNGNADKDQYLSELLEKTAFEGQILWLTFQEDNKR